MGEDRGPEKGLCNLEERVRIREAKRMNFGQLAQKTRIVDIGIPQEVLSVRVSR